MRALPCWVVLFAVQLAAANPLRAEEIDVDFEPRRPRQQCLGPASWPQIAQCLKQTAPAIQIGARPSAHVQLVFDKTLPLASGGFQTRMYVQRLDGKWQMLRAIDPANAQIVGERTMSIDGAKQPAIRIELRETAHYTSAALRGLLRIKTAIVCQAASCQQLTYACSYLENGRMRSMLAGELVSHDGVVAVEGDRSFADGNCNR